MKKAIITIVSIVAFVMLISEPDAMTFGIFIIKAVALVWLWIIAKANNYFYQGE